MKTKTTVFYDDNDVQSFNSVKNYLFETFADEESDVESNAMHNMDLQALHEALKNLTPKEYDLIYKLARGEE